MPNRAFVRYKKCGAIVPGSLILTNGTYPEPLAGWIEVPMKMECGSIRITETATAGDPDEICFGGFSISYDGGYQVMATTWYGPVATVAQLITGLNTAYGFLGKWSADGLAISLDMKPEVANALLTGHNLASGSTFSMAIYCGG